MAKLMHGGIQTSAKCYRLASSKPAYAFQHCYHTNKCKHCGGELMAWKGEYPDGNFTALIAIPKQEYEHWKRRIKAGEAKPEAQLISEYTRKIAGEILAQGEYQTKLCKAHKWYKGQKI